MRAWGGGGYLRSFLLVRRGDLRRSSVPCWGFGGTQSSARISSFLRLCLPAAVPERNAVRCSRASPSVIAAHSQRSISCLHDVSSHILRYADRSHSFATMAAKHLWFEEEIEEDFKISFNVNKVIHSGVSKFQSMDLLDTPRFGKVLVLDGKVQSAEMDELVYHESLVHPALLYHPCPKRVFIMGGGEGSTAREALKHKSVTKVVMCDIDEVVVDFCKHHLSMNNETFSNPRLEVIINDARNELEKEQEGYDVIIGDLADPVAGGPCYQLYTKAFYENVVKRRLKPGGIFVTQAGPAGVLSHQEVFTIINNTLQQVFTYVFPYAQHIPSYADTWGWILASIETLPKFCASDVDERIAERIMGKLSFLDGQTLLAILALNKLVKQSLENETHVYTEESARFIHGQGVVGRTGGGES